MGISGLVVHIVIHRAVVHDCVRCDGAVMVAFSDSADVADSLKLFHAGLDSVDAIGRYGSQVGCGGAPGVRFGQQIDQEATGLETEPLVIDDIVADDCEVVSRPSAANDYRLYAKALLRM